MGGLVWEHLHRRRWRGDGIGGFWMGERGGADTTWVLGTSETAGREHVGGQ